VFRAEEATASQHPLKCYLALPIQGVRGRDALYTQLAASLSECGVEILNPEVVHAPPLDLDESFAATAIASDNLRKLAQADLLLAEISWPSLGVGYEIAAAERAGIPVIAIHGTSDRSVSKMILGNVRPHVHIFQYGEGDTLDRLAYLAVSWMLRLRYVERDQKVVCQRLVEHFAALAPLYDGTTQWRRHPRILEWFSNNLGPGDVLLDVGSGTGIVAEAARREGGTVVRLDVSEPMLRRGSFGERVLGDAERLPIRSKAVDNLLLRQVLHYVDAERVLHEARRVLRPGGRLLLGQIVAPNDEVSRWWFELRRITQPLQRTVYTTPHLTRVVKDAGFQVAKVDSLTVDRSDTWETFVGNALEGSSWLVREYLSLAPPALARRIGLQTSNDQIAYRQDWGLVVCLP
jgi:2'-deoxynucleoside 5'-phosphate N-hydrolase